MFSALFSWLRSECLRNLAGATRSRKPQRPTATTGKPFRPRLETLEDRAVPANFTAASVSDLIADINAANRHGGSNTITLVAGNTFTLNAVNNATDGATGLPVIAAKDNLTVIGNGDTIARSTAAGTPTFRLFDVAGRGSLTLKDLTLQCGLAFGSGVSAEGGAISNRGTLDLNGVTVQNNVAWGDGPHNAASGVLTATGGGIYSSGSLTLEAATKVLNNQAQGGQGYVYFQEMLEAPAVWGIVRGGDGLGGGVYVGSGTLSVTNASVSSNTVLGGLGADGATYIHIGFPDSIATLFPSAGGNGLGGGLYMQAGTVALTNASVSANTAQGGQGGKGISIRNSDGPLGLGEGGGIYIYPGASVRLDAFTLAHIQQNEASTSDPDIAGSYGMI
jgi:hypothetical protein